MKKRYKNTLALCLMLAGGTLCALAVSFNSARANDVSEELYGLLNVQGTLVASACYLAPETAKQEVDMGVVTPLSLKRPGDVTVPKTVKLVLDGCPEQWGIREDPLSNGRQYGLSGQPTVRIVVLGDREPEDPRFFQLQGNIKGVALRLENHLGETISPGWKGPVHILNPGRHEIQFKVQLWCLNEDIQPGEWQAIVNIGLEYE